jgi:hypothetical protein
MSNDLVHIQTPRALTALEGNVDSINEAIATNISSGGISDVDLPRVRISGGSTPRWIVPTLEGEDTLDRIIGVIAFARDTRVYYPIAFGKRNGRQPPGCSSSDGMSGRGKPGGECLRCPLAEFGSAEEGGGQACKQVKQLFLLRDELLLPDVVSLPPTSLKAARQFFLQLTRQGLTYREVIVSLELERAQNAAGNQYGRAVLKFVRRLTPEEAARAHKYNQLCRALAERVPTGLDPEVQGASSE